MINADQDWAIPMIGAGVSYAAGVFLVTGIRNVPMNRSLAEATQVNDATIALWQRYVRDWTRWNHVRTGFAVVSMVLFGTVLLVG